MSKRKNPALIQSDVELELAIGIELAASAAGIVASEPMAVIEKRRRLEAQGWRAWYGEIFGLSFINALEEWHEEAIEWHWDSRMQLLRGETPEYDANFCPWPREFMKCVAGSSEVLLGSGKLLQIKDVKVGDVIQSVDEATGQIVKKPVLAHWNAGEKECVKLRTRSGWELVATPDHQVWTFDGWKRISELTAKDRIASPRRTLSSADLEDVTDEEIRLLTYFLAEGNTTTSGGTSFSANITTADSEIAQDLQACADAIGFQVKKSAAKMRWTFSKGVRPWLDMHGLRGKKATEKALPSWFFEMSERQAAQSLGAWLDTDGFISPKQAGITLANSKLIQELRYLCLKLGIVTRTYHNSKRGAGAWTLNIDYESLERASKIPLRLKADRWSSLLSQPRASLVDSYPSQVITDLPFGVNRQMRRDGWRASYGYDRIRRDKLRRGIELQRIPRWVWLEQADVFWDEVKSIEPAETLETFDIQVADTHNFIADGLVVHNSTLARRVAVCEAAISGSAYILYTGGTQAKVGSHALSISKLLENQKLLEYYPLLGSVETTDRGKSKGDRQEFRYTQHGSIFHFISLETGVAGTNVEDVRPTLIVLDDTSERGDSPAVAEKRMGILTTSVLPTGQKNTLFFSAENLINPWSIPTKILRNEVRVLTNRKPARIIPAVYDLKTEVRTVNGVVQDVVVSGRPSWKFFGLDRVQKAINSEGLVAFKKERQHEVDADVSGLVLPEYDERVHVITRSQFEAVYGTREIPADWRKYIGHDWGNVHPCVVSAIAVSSVRSRRPGLHFLFAGIEAPQNSMEDDVAVAMINRFFPKVNTKGLQQLDPEAIAKWQTGKLGDLLTAPRELAQRTVGKAVNEALKRDRSWQVWNMSHEQKKRCEVYRAVYGLPFNQINPGADGGVDEIRRLLRVDYKEPHPFKPGEKGYSQFFLVVEDDQYYEDGPGGLVSKARDDKGLKLWREQIPKWRRPEPKLLESGLQSDQKPLKFNDDTGNSLMMIYVQVGLPSEGQFTLDEKVEIQLPEEYKSANLPALVQEGGAAAWHALEDKKAQVQKDLGVPVKEFTGMKRATNGAKSLRELRKSRR